MMTLPSDSANLIDTIPLDSSYRHILALGSTGSGKTRYFLLPYLQKFLAGHGAAADTKAGALIIDAKGDMAESIRRILRNLGREEDLIVLGRKGNAWCDPLDFIGRDCRNLAEELIQLTAHNRKIGSRNDEYWVENARRLLTIAAIIAKIHGFGRIDGIGSIDKAVSYLASVREQKSNDSPGSLVRLANWAITHSLVTQPEGFTLLQYIGDDLANLPSSTWTCICNYARLYLSAVVDGSLADLFLPSEQRPKSFRPEKIINQGQIAIVSLSAVHYGPMADTLRIMVKMGFQKAILRRYDILHFDGKEVHPLARRPICFVADEFATTLTTGRQDFGDPFFLSQAREFRCACVLATQGVSALHAAANGDTASIAHLLNNCATKPFLNTTCPETLDLLGKLSDGREEADPGDAPLFRLPIAPTASTLSKACCSSPRNPRKLVRYLKVGEGLLLCAGRTIHGCLTPLDNPDWRHEGMQ